MGGTCSKCILNKSKITPENVEISFIQNNIHTDERYSEFDLEPEVIPEAAIILPTTARLELIPEDSNITAECISENSDSSNQN